MPSTPIMLRALQGQVVAPGAPEALILLDSRGQLRLTVFAFSRLGLVSRDCCYFHWRPTSANSANIIVALPATIESNATVEFTATLATSPTCHVRYELLDGVGAMWTCWRSPQRALTPSASTARPLAARVLLPPPPSP